MPSLSIALATFAGDQTSVILRCLKSVYDWADEIVIVYGSPEDETTKAIREMDVRKKVVLHLKDNPANFHINKQKSIELCTNEWIFEIDSDEVVSAESRQEILSILSHDTEVSGYRMPRLNFLLGTPLRKGGQYPDPVIRLFKNGSGRLPTKSVHELVTIDGSIGDLTQPLLHYPYATFKDYLDKWIRYNRLETDTLIKNKENPSLLMYFFILPPFWFLKTYFRHKGCYDGFAGFVFALFSAIRYWLIYIFFIEKIRNR